MTAWHPENENAFKTQDCLRYGTPSEIKAKTKKPESLGYDTPPEIKAHVLVKTSTSHPMTAKQHNLLQKNAKETYAC